MENKIYSNRESDHPNRRKLNIISQTSTEIVVDVLRYEGDIKKVATSIDKSVFDTWDKSVNDAMTFSTVAKEKSKSAL